MDWILEKYHFVDFKQKLTNYKRICELIIVFFLIFLYLLLKNSKIPRLEHQFTRSYRQIDWQKHVPERIKRIRKHEIPAPSTEITESNQSSFDWTEILDTDFLKNDISSILNQQPERSLLNIPERMNSREQTNKLPLDNTEPSILIDEQRDYLKDNATNLLPRIQVEPKNIGPSVTINDIVVNQSNLGNNQIYPNRDQASITTDKIIPEAGVIEIPLISREKVNTNPDISVIIDQLMLWMKKHPYEFNKVIKSFMMHEPNDLTSKVVFRYKNRVFELYLLYKYKIKEIRICLIESRQSTMLIDSGFKRQSNYLRTGNVSRLEDDTIFSFSTSQYPASEKTTSEFYQFFLSWWEQAKREN